MPKLSSSAEIIIYLYSSELFKNFKSKLLKSISLSCILSTFDKESIIFFNSSCLLLLFKIFFKNPQYKFRTSTSSLFTLWSWSNFFPISTINEFSFSPMSFNLEKSSVP